MRSPLALVLLGLSLSVTGCTVGDAGGGGGGGGGTPDGGGSGNEPDAPTVVPRLVSSVDKTSVTSELGKTETVTVTLTSEGGFEGPVTITSSLVNPQGQPLAPVTVQGPTSVSLSSGQTNQAAFTITIPANASGGDFTGTLKLDINSSLGAESLSAGLAVAAVYTFDTPAGAGSNPALHPGTNKSITVKRGARIAFHNSDSIEHITHGNSPFPHEGNGATAGAPNGTYTVETTAVAPGTSSSLGCHSHPGQNDVTYAAIRVE